MVADAMATYCYGECCHLRLDFCEWEVPPWSSRSIGDEISVALLPHNVCPIP